MNNNNIKKLTLYALDCIKATAKNSMFNNLKNSKVIITDAVEFEADNKEIIEMMTLHALNRSTMGIYKGMLMLEGVRSKEKFYSPLLYCDAELVRDGDIIRLEYEEENINVGLISSLLDNDSEIIENTINQLLEIDEPSKIDFKKVLSGLINLDGLTIKEENAVILARTPESIAGLVNELKAIAELY